MQLVPLHSGWDHTAWGGEEPTAEWFSDAVDKSGVPGRTLAWLLRADAHTGVASPAALRLAGITAATPDPPGGVIVRKNPNPTEGETGAGGGAGAGAGAGAVPTGVLRDNAMTLVTSLIPPVSEADRVRAFKRAFTHLLSMGITSVCDFGDIDHLAGSAVEGATERVWRDLAILERLDGYGKLPIRVSAYLPLADWKRVRDHPARNGGWFRDRNSNMMRGGGGGGVGGEGGGGGGGGGGEKKESDDDASSYEYSYAASSSSSPSSSPSSYGDSSRVRVAGCKAFLDGSLGAGTALMREPYADDPTNRGIAVCNLTEFTQRVVGADAAGLQVGLRSVN
jgi:predicted amidohydrolase YtcJ